MHLDQVGEEPFHAPHQAAVHQHRPPPGTGRVGVRQVELLRLVEVELHGGEGRLPTGRVDDLDVDLRTVEGGLAGCLLVLHPVERGAQQLLGAGPGRVVPDVLRPRPAQRQPEPGRADAERGVRLPDQPQDLPDLVADLLQGAEVVRVVERDGPHPGQPAEHPGPLRPVHPAQLADAQRQLPVGAPAGPVDQRVVRAERRPEHELVVGAQPHRREHLVGEVAEVPGQREQLPLAQRWGVDVLVAGPALQLADVLLDGVPGRRAGRQPDRQPGPGQRIGDEQVQLPAEPTVVDHVALLDRVRPGGDLPRNAARPRADRPGPRRR